MHSKNFKSKILLFGEYSIIHNSMGLTIPFDFYKGKLTFKSRNLTAEQAQQSNADLKTYATYLKGLVEKNELGFAFDIDTLLNDIEKGLIFDSTIPQGYGVGSSGALVAALYEKYAFDKVYNEDALSSDDILKLKSQFAKMECYFHGTSSGLDPLICYLQHPILIENKEAIGAVNIPASQLNGNGGIFLIDTKQVGKTGPLVQLFLDKCKEDGFLGLVRKEMIPFNDNCIKAFLKGEAKDLLSNVKELSHFLISHLDPMVPKRFRKVWKKGLESESYYLKLCGSGGGGYLLGFAPDLEKAKADLKDYNIEIIHRF